jgi:hypothetical protein
LQSNSRRERYGRNLCSPHATRRASLDGGRRRLIPEAGDGEAGRWWWYAGTWEGGRWGLGLGSLGGSAVEVKEQGRSRELLAQSTEILAKSIRLSLSFLFSFFFPRSLRPYAVSRRGLSSVRVSRA